MTLINNDYKKRLIDDKIEEYLKVFGAICIEGPKWCGKTWTSLNYGNSVTYLTEKAEKNLARENPIYIFKDENPQLIDEWQIVPSLWDAVRHKCDEDSKKGKFILTGSTTLSKEDSDNEEVYHSGAGRIATLKMFPMSLYESKDSTGDISIMDMFNNKKVGKSIKKYELNLLAELIIRGGWLKGMLL